MTQLFTPNDVVLYLYKEIPDKETEQLQRLLMTDADLNGLYQDMAVSKELIEQVNLEPSDRIIDAILQYSQSYHPA